MIYPQVGPILSNDDITGHLSADFYSIWNNGLVGISWSYRQFVRRKIFRLFKCILFKRKLIAAAS